MMALVLSAALLFGLPLANSRASQAQAQGVDISFSFFNDALSPYGNWVDNTAYGTCWRPSNVSAGWQPYYSDGHWVYTEYGWSWVSNNPWGDVAYHYGTWYDDQNYGWLWVPGYTWASSWVTWQYNDNYVGWAPMPPTFNGQLGYGQISYGYNGNRGYYPYNNNGYGYNNYNGYGYSYNSQPVVVNNNYYVFVPAQNMTATNLAQVRVPVQRNYEIIRQARPATTIQVINNHVVNPGPRNAVIERAMQNPVPIQQVLRDNRFQPRAVQINQVKRNLRITDPTVTRQEAHRVVRNLEVQQRQARQLQLQQQQQTRSTFRDVRQQERVNQQQQLEQQRTQRQQTRTQQQQQEQQQLDQRRQLREQQQQQDQQLRQQRQQDRQQRVQTNQQQQLQEREQRRNERQQQQQQLEQLQQQRRQQGVLNEQQQEQRRQIREQQRQGDQQRQQQQMIQQRQQEREAQRGQQQQLRQQQEQMQQQQRQQLHQAQRQQDMQVQGQRQQMQQQRQAERQQMHQQMQQTQQQQRQERQQMRQERRRQ